MDKLTRRRGSAGEDQGASLKALWKDKPVREVLRLEYGKPLDDVDRKSNGLYPVYGANGEKDRSDKFYFDRPSIIVGRKGSAGEVNLTGERFWPLDVTYFVTFDEQEYELRFLYYLLKTLDLPSLAKGVKPGINRNEVYSQITKIPPLHEQRRIVSILDEAFEGIATAKATAEKNIQNARVLFESHLQSVFTQRGEGWGDGRLGDLATFRNGINFTKSSLGDSVKIVGVKDFQNNFLAPLDNLDTVTTDGKLPDSDTLKENDLLFVRSNGNMELIGRCLLVGAVAEKITHSGFTIRARLHSTSLTPKYLCHFLKSNNARREMIDSGIGTNIKSLNQATLSALVIHFPSSAMQARIVCQLEALNIETQRLESIYQCKLAALQELKKSLLHQAFTGLL